MRASRKHLATVVRWPERDAWRGSPAFTSPSAASPQQRNDSVAHRDHSPAVGGLAVGHKDDFVVPVDVLDAHPVSSLSFRIPVSRISMTMSRKSSCLPECPIAALDHFSAANSSFSSASSSSRRFRPYSFSSLIFGSAANQLPFFRFVKHAAQGPEGTIGVGGGAGEVLVCSTSSAVIMSNRIPASGVAPKPPAVAIILLGFRFQFGALDPFEETHPKSTSPGSFSRQRVLGFHGLRQLNGRN